MGDVGTFKGGFGFPENEQGNDSGIPFYKVSDMNDRYNALMMKRASNYVSDSQIDINNWKPILGQNIIFAKVGAAVYLERKRKVVGPFLLDNNMMSFQPKNADIDYIYYIFQRLHISKYAQVGTLPSLNAGELRNIKINIPSLAEQRVVANIGVKIDQTITLHEEKKCQLERLKSALLQKLFADENGNPAVRFKDFSEAWESRKLFDVIVKIIDFRGRTPKKMGLNWSERGYLALSALNVKDGFIDFSTDAHYANEILYKKWMSGNELLKGQVLFTTEAPMGNVAQVPDDSGYVLSQRTISFVSNNSEITDNFLAVVLRSSKVQRALSTLASGGTAKGVSQSTLSQLIMVIPISLDEQQKIERIIRIVEELTRLYQNKLEILTELKKSLLQKMFI